ncbi:DUF6578 domain-containing protein [Streptomyces huasconensis]|uniref:DUF6578 domain-containing protein n=1 Tax=Streptomyces huasconensis TaxID=1854574 RepID=A0ABV3LR29_9ACTN
MALWKVMYADWQMECCGEPFAVGDEVAWPLLVDGDRLDDAGWASDLSEIEGPVVALDTLEGDWSGGGADYGDYGDGADYGGGGDGEFQEPWEPSVVRARGVTVPWARPRPWPERARLAGLLTVERHSGRWPDTVGRVRAIHVVTQGFAQTVEGSETYAPVPGERWLRPVEACPKWFRDEDLTRARPEPGNPRQETGVLVELDVRES